MSHSYCEERVLLCNTPPIRMNIVSYCEGGCCYTTLHKMDLVSRGGLLISYMSSDIYISYALSILYPRLFQQVIMRCRQDSIHSNPNDISSSEGDRSIHLTRLIGCRMLKEDDILIISCGDDEVSISSSKWMRGLDLQYSIHSKHEWYLVSRGRYLWGHSSLAGWCRHILSHTYICHDMSHCTHTNDTMRCWA